MAEREAIYLEKAVESLDGAASELVNGRYTNCANRCYYSCFQAAIYGLAEAGVQPAGARATWSHETLQGAFARELISRRKVYSGDLRSVLLRNQELRLTADYEPHTVTQTQALRALRRTETFIEAIQRRGARS